MLAVVLVLLGIEQSRELGRRSPGLDFYQFWVVSQVAGREDVPSVYADEARARVGAEFVRRSLTDEDSERRRVAARPWQVLEPTATPFFYAAFRPLPQASYESAHALFRGLSLLGLAAGVLAIAALVGVEVRAALLLLAFVALAFQPLKADIRVGNVNQLQLAAIAAYLWLSARPSRSPLQVLAGVALGGLVSFKPNLAPVVPVLATGWLLAGRHDKLLRQAAGLAGGAMATLLTTRVVYGRFGIWSDWLAYLASLPPAKIPLRYGNIGLDRLLFEAMGRELSPLLAFAAIGAALACLWWGRSRTPAPLPRPGTSDDTAAFAAGCLVYLLSAPMVWLHYLLLALPAVLALLRPDEAPWRRSLAVLALVAIAVDPVAEVFGLRDLRLQAVMTTLALLLLLALVCRELARGWRPERAGRGGQGEATTS